MGIRLIYYYCIFLEFLVLIMILLLLYNDCAVIFGDYISIFIYSFICFDLDKLILYWGFIVMI